VLAEPCALLDAGGAGLLTVLITPGMRAPNLGVIDVSNCAANRFVMVLSREGIRTYLAFLGTHPAWCPAMTSPRTAVVAGTIRPVTWLVAALVNKLDASIIVLLPAPTASARASMATFEQLGALGRAEEQL
jgi:hypothetical protein